MKISCSLTEWKKEKFDKQLNIAKLYSPQRPFIITPGAFDCFR